MTTYRPDCITKHDLARALGLIGREVADMYDGSCDGLLLRVSKASATWYVRGRLGKTQKMWRVKAAARSDDPKEIREKATEARLLAARGIDPAQMLTEYALGGKVERTFDEEKDGWVWEQAREEYLSFIKSNRRKATYQDYRATLNKSDLDVWNGKILKNITKRDVKSVQDAIYDRGAARMATHTLTILKGFFSWCADRGASGIEDSPAVNVRALAITTETPGDEGVERVPSHESLGRLPWQLDATRLQQSVRLGAMLVLLTCQRRATIVSARKQDFKEIPGHGALWNIPSAYMKAGARKPKGADGQRRRHVVPLPPFTWSLVRQAMAMTPPGEEWLFPQVRLRRAGDIGGGHLSEKEIGDGMKDAKSPIRPHAMRRAFGTYGGELLGFTNDEIKTILDHEEGRSGDVTDMHYSLGDGTHFKWPMMKKWEDFILNLMAEHKPEGKGELPSFIA